ncbi:MAG TPA: hypothetical protein VF114_09070 [Candidatus Limnocylindria bacterium]
MVRLTRFGVVRTASVAAIVYLILSAIIFIPVALLVGTMPITTVDQVGQPVSVRISPIVFLFLPLIYAVFGWIFTAIACLIYNLAAWITGGIEFEAVPVAPAPPRPVVYDSAPPPPVSPPAAPPETGAP